MNIYKRTNFVQGIAQLLFFRANYGHMDVEEDYVTADRFPLGEFVKGIRQAYYDRTLWKEYAEQLRNIGFSMEKRNQAWESMYVLAKNYAEAHDGALPGATVRTSDEVLLGAWVRKQRVTFARLSEEQQERLREIGITG